MAVPNRVIVACNQSGKRIRHLEKVASGWRLALALSFKFILKDAALLLTVT